MLEIQTLSFRRNIYPLFQNLNFQISPGELLQVTGANGSGKTTLLRILAGLLKPTSGDIRFSQGSIYQNKSDYQTHVAYLGHHNALKPGLTIKENLISHGLLMGATAFKLETLLEQFNLASYAEMLAHQLSQGQQRRLALAKILLSQKCIWILDEPLTTLDQQGINQFNKVPNYSFDKLFGNKQHLETNGIVVVATHQPLKVLSSIKPLVLGCS